VREELRQFMEVRKGLESGKREFVRSQGVFRKWIGRRSSDLVVREISKKVHPELLKLTSILGKGSLKRPCIWESVSLSEGSVQSYFLTDHAFLREWTKQHWVRAYPSSSRVDSSNYNPIRTSPCTQPPSNSASSCPPSTRSRPTTSPPPSASSSAGGADGPRATG
jgi:hypothetical protein